MTCVVWFEQEAGAIKAHFPESGVLLECRGPFQSQKALELYALPGICNYLAHLGSPSGDLYIVHASEEKRQIQATKFESHPFLSHPHLNIYGHHPIADLGLFIFHRDGPNNLGDRRLGIDTDYYLVKFAAIPRSSASSKAVEIVKVEAFAAPSLPSLFDEKDGRPGLVSVQFPVVWDFTNDADSCDHDGKVTDALIFTWLIESSRTFAGCRCVRYQGRKHIVALDDAMMLTLVDKETVYFQKKDALFRHHLPSNVTSTVLFHPIPSSMRMRMSQPMPNTFLVKLWHLDPHAAYLRLEGVGCDREDDIYKQPPFPLQYLSIIIRYPLLLEKDQKLEGGGDLDFYPLDTVMTSSSSSSSSLIQPSWPVVRASIEKLMNSDNHDDQTSVLMKTTVALAPSGVFTLGYRNNLEEEIKGLSPLASTEEGAMVLLMMFKGPTTLDRRHIPYLADLGAVPPRHVSRVGPTQIGSSVLIDHSYPRHQWLNELLLQASASTPLLPDVSCLIASYCTSCSSILNHPTFPRP